VVVAMVQGGKHGGSVAGPVAQHILEQIMAMDQGSYSPQLVALKPADNPHPFNEIDAMPDYSGTTPALVAAGDESAPDNQTPGAAPEMARSGASPDIKADADDQGNVNAAIRKAAHPEAASAPKRRSLLERIFNPQPDNNPQAAKRSHWPF
jgi:hypothetical protein